MSASPPPIAMNVAHVIHGYPKHVQDYALGLRQIIFEVARKDARIGSLTETLKWREPSYLTDQTRSGTTLRFDWKEKNLDQLGLFVSCQTNLISSFRDVFGSALNFEGNRAIWLDLSQPIPTDILEICIAKTLTYHVEKGIEHE